MVCVRAALIRVSVRLSHETQKLFQFVEKVSTLDKKLLLTPYAAETNPSPPSQRLCMSVVIIQVTHLCSLLA